MDSARLILFFLLVSVKCFSQKDTLHIYFPTDVSELDTTSQNFLRSKQLQLRSKQHILVIGYADERGDVPYNKTLSFKRARNVADMIAGLGIGRERIKLIVGRGEIGRTDGNLQVYEQDRRVDIVEVIDSTTARDTVGMPDLPSQIINTPVGEAVILKNVYFYLASTDIMLSSIATLDMLLKTMKDNPTLKIRLEGHICCVPTGEEALYRPAGLRLSYYRAATIKTYLTDNGIDEERIGAVGFGMDHPLVKNEITEEDRKSNRRVEVRIIAK
jgi:outer membrane protein OmpA-like peptidoglycan-associated protein